MLSSGSGFLGWCITCLLRNERFKYFYSFDSACFRSMFCFDLTACLMWHVFDVRVIYVTEKSFKIFLLLSLCLSLSTYKLLS